MPWTRVRLNAFGGPEVLERETVPDLPQPGAGEVRVRVASAAFTDVTAKHDLISSPCATPIEATGGGIKALADDRCITGTRG